jgi:hypothetical protein
MTLDYELALELANAFGFCVSFVLGFVLTWLLIARTRKLGWVYDQVTKLNVGMILVKIALCLRLGIGWIASSCQIRPGVPCESIDSASWLLLLSMVIFAIGGLMMLRALISRKYIYWY